MKKVSIIGGGAWGSAFAVHLSRKKITSHLWIRENEIYEQALKDRENTVFLPGVKFPAEVSFFNHIAEAVRSTMAVFVAVPSQFCRKVYEMLAPHLTSKQIIISLTKGIEDSSLMRMSEIMEEVFSPYFPPRVAVLSGPSFSREVALGYPTAVVVASKDLNLARKVQHLVSNLYFRAYASTDVVGVELCGALKNVIAIAAGISYGLELGQNSAAALMTRGLAEIARLGMKLGAKKETFSGLAGIGDLVLTCTGTLSRNRSVGVELGKGKSLEEITSKMKMVAEGIKNTLSAHQLSKRENVELPICEQVYKILYRHKDPRESMNKLMRRKLRDE
ncbi:MAG: NAD(P)H-dependent glycerol-3-phosphate dehydrogenase [Candidatus Aminicenantales bacterium]